VVPAVAGVRLAPQAWVASEQKRNLSRRHGGMPGPVLHRFRCDPKILALL